MNHTPRRVGLFVLGIVVIGALSAAGTFAVLHYTHPGAKKAAPVANIAQKTPGHPQFSFDATAAPNWYQGPVDKVSLAMFSRDKTSGCWASIEHKPGTVDADSELQKIQTTLTNSGETVTPGAIVPMTLQTTGGTVSYELHQYTVTPSGNAEKPYGGQEFAYFSLMSGYGKVQAYCTTAAQLATVTPALAALKFDTTK